MDRVGVKVIHKHKIERETLDLASPCGVLLDTGGDPRVIHVAAQKDGDDLPTVWIECDPGQDGGLAIMVVPTGHEAPAGMRHVGSAVCRWGQLVWHLYTPGEAEE